MKYVPVVDLNQKPLMPCSEKRARKMIESGKGTPFWKKGVFCVRLNVEPSARNYQEVAVGIDPGSKEEGVTVKSKAHDYLNIQMEAVQYVKERVETRKNLRRARRFRKTPCRKNKINRPRGGFPPSTKARWGWKLRIISWLKRIFPITIIVIEDIKAKTKKFQRKWNKSFSPLEVGKKWFYEECEKLGKLIKIQGYQTAEIREKLGLKKLKNKLSTNFYAHCVDSWVLASIGLREEKGKPENEKVLRIIPLKFHRRQLHKMNHEKGGIRKPYGGTRSLGFKRGSLVRHFKWGLSYVGGHSRGRLSLCSIETGKILNTWIKPEDCRFLTYLSWRFN